MNGFSRKNREQQKNPIDLSGGFSNPLFEGDSLSSSGNFSNPLFAGNNSSSYAGGNMAGTTSAAPQTAAPAPQTAAPAPKAAAPAPQTAAPAPAPVAGRASLQFLQDNLLKIKKGGGGENSDKFNLINNLLGEINAHVASDSFSGDILSCVGKMSDMSERYDNLLAACDVYTDHIALSIPGHRRKAIVRQIREQAAKDAGAIRIAKGEIGAASTADRTAFTWNSLLERARSLKISVKPLSSSDKTSKGQASDVYKLRPDNASLLDEKGAKTALGGTLFFKADDSVDAGDSATTMALKDILPLLKNPALRPTLINDAHDFYDYESAPTPSGSKEYDEISMLLFKRVLRYKVLKESILSSINITGKTNMSRRNVATSRLAELMGVGHLVARSRTAELTEEGENGAEDKVIKGIVMDQAKGLEYSDVESTLADMNAKKAPGEAASPVITPSGQKDLSSLQVLDVICGQGDRHLGNMFYQQDDHGAVTGVQGIDNDAAFGLNENVASLSDAERSDALVYENGQLVIPHMDATLAQHILSVTPQLVKFVLVDLLKPDEIEACCKRLTLTQDAIRNAKPGQLVPEGGWNDATLKTADTISNTSLSKGASDFSAATAALNNEAMALFPYNDNFSNDEMTKWRSDLDEYKKERLAALKKKELNDFAHKNYVGYLNNSLHNPLN